MSQEKREEKNKKNIEKHIKEERSTTYVQKVPMVV
jgi:hypothetical protein